MTILAKTETPLAATDAALSSQWPNLPQALKNGVYGQAGTRIFVGLGSAGQAFYALDLATPPMAWGEMAAFPGPARDGAAAAMVGGTLFVFSGLGKALPHDTTPCVLQDAYAFDSVKNRWSKLATKTPAGLLGAAAFAIDDDRIGFVGGVNTRVFDGFIKASQPANKESDPEAWQRRVEDFMGMPPQAHKWNSRILVYSISANAWSDLGENPFLPNTGAALVADADGVLLINGEIKPGLRTPQVKHIGFKTGRAIWTEQEPIPPLAGHALQDGLAGAYAGYASGVLVVAGGANFHGSRAIAATGEWYAHRGLRKVWNREIYARLNGGWAVAGQLPTGLAYGACFTIPQGLLVVGGEDATQSPSDKVILLEWDATRNPVICRA